MTNDIIFKLRARRSRAKGEKNSVIDASRNVAIL